MAIQKNRPSQRQIPEKKNHFVAFKEERENRVMRHFRLDLTAEESARLVIEHRLKFLIHPRIQPPPN